MVEYCVVVYDMIKIKVLKFKDLCIWGGFIFLGSFFFV